ncbi:MAG: hypothetical protein AB1846_04080, partial [Chloroflexota bacterium]
MSNDKPGNRLGLLILLSFVACTACLCLFIFASWSQAAGDDRLFPVAIHSGRYADYSADPGTIPNIGLEIIGEVLVDHGVPTGEIGFRLATMTAALQTPMPSATSAQGVTPTPTGAESTQTSAPLPGQTATGTASPSPTAWIPFPTLTPFRTATPTPSLTATASATFAPTFPASPTPTKRRRPTRTPTSTPTRRPRRTPT